jgi:hypothetical protein
MSSLDWRTMARHSSVASHRVRIQLIRESIPLNKSVAGAFDMQTPMPNRDKEKQGPFAGLFSPFKTPLSTLSKQLGWDFKGEWCSVMPLQATDVSTSDGKTPLSSREMETKELRDFWKQYLKTPLSGGGPLGMLNGMSADGELIVII